MLVEQEGQVNCMESMTEKDLASVSALEYEETAQEMADCSGMLCANPCASLPSNTAGECGYMFLFDSGKEVNGVDMLHTLDYELSKSLQKVPKIIYNPANSREESAESLRSAVNEYGMYAFQYTAQPSKSDSPALEEPTVIVLPDTLTNPDYTIDMQAETQPDSWAPYVEPISQYSEQLPLPIGNDDSHSFLNDSQNIIEEQEERPNFLISENMDEEERYDIPQNNHNSSVMSLFTCGMCADAPKREEQEPEQEEPMQEEYPQQYTSAEADSHYVQNFDNTCDPAYAYSIQMQDNIQDDNNNITTFMTEEEKYIAAGGIMSPDNMMQDAYQYMHSNNFAKWQDSNYHLIPVASEKVFSKRKPHDKSSQWSTAFATTPVPISSPGLAAAMCGCDGGINPHSQVRTYEATEENTPAPLMEMYRQQQYAAMQDAIYQRSNVVVSEDAPVLASTDFLNCCQTNDPYIVCDEKLQDEHTDAVETSEKINDFALDSNADEFSLQASEEVLKSQPPQNFDECIPNNCQDKDNNLSQQPSFLHDSNQPLFLQEDSFGNISSRQASFGNAINRQESYVSTINKQNSYDNSIQESDDQPFNQESDDQSYKQNSDNNDNHNNDQQSQDEGSVLSQE